MNQSRGLAPVSLTFTCLCWLIKYCCILSKWRSSIITISHVKNGVIVLNNGVQLPEGQEVTVLVPDARPTGPQPHSILDIAPVSLGVLLRPLTAEDDLLGEMLNGGRRGK